MSGIASIRKFALTFVCKQIGVFDSAEVQRLTNNLCGNFREMHLGFTGLTCERPSEWLSNLVHSPKTSLDKHKTWYTFLVLLFISCFPDNAQNPETFRKASWRLYWKDTEIRQRVGPCWTQGYPRFLLFFGCFFFMRWCLVFSHLFALICVSPMFFR